ncbi:MAG: LmbE family N-acetylglucosaminyl deacetylase [Sphingobacteriales bacterium]|jgi:LmbE family N-acetylglucosaminyl deacetylase
MKNKTYLTVTAHPDDEILGFGGSTFKLSSNGHKIYNLILSGSVEARRHKPNEEELISDTNEAQAIVGAEKPILGPFPNIKFNSVPHLDLVQFIEKYLEQIQPDVVLTHHPYDLNNDHYHTSKACQAAVRLFQRKPVKPVEAFYFMEILSSTDWAFPVDGQNFQPNAFMEIGEDGLSKKLESLNAYRGVMRNYPHPRSVEALTGSAACRGAQAGLIYAEAFQCVFKRGV